MTAIRLAWAAALAAALALFPLPWYAGRVEALLLLLPDRPWQWPGLACPGGAAATALAVPRAGRALVALAAAALLPLLLQGIAIGLPTTARPIAEALFGAGVRQPAFGPGAAVALAGATLLMALGFARARAFNADTTVALIAPAGAVSLALFVFLPLLRVLLDVCVAAGRFSLAVAFDRLAAPEAWGLACLAGGVRCGVVWNTLLLATLTGALSTLLGLAFALLETRGGLTRRGLFRALAVLPLITPPFVVALALIVLFGRTGIVTTLLWELFDVHRTRWIYGLPGVLLAQLLSQTPIAFLLLSAALRAIAPSLEEAARRWGRSPAACSRPSPCPCSVPRLPTPLSSASSRASATSAIRSCWGVSSMCSPRASFSPSPVPGMSRAGLPPSRSCCLA